MLHNKFKTARISEIVAAMHTVQEKGGIALLDRETSHVFVHIGKDKMLSCKLSSENDTVQFESAITFSSPDRFMILPPCPDKSIFTKKIISDFILECLSITPSFFHHIPTNHSMTGSLAVKKEPYTHAKAYERYRKANSLLSYLEQLVNSVPFSNMTTYERFLRIEGFFSADYLFNVIGAVELVTDYIQHQSRYFDEIDHITAISWCISNGIPFDTGTWFSPHFPHIVPPNTLVLP